MKKWSLCLTATAAFIGFMLMAIAVNPVLMYAHRATLLRGGVLYDLSLIQGPRLLALKPSGALPALDMGGYPEYVARRGLKSSLRENIIHLLDTEKTEHNGWILFSDSARTMTPYYQSRLLTQCCLDVRI